MRRQSYPNKKWFQRPESAYARSDSWTTRHYHRKTGGSIIAAMAGLNVTDSDFTKKKGESPFLMNARMNGTKETRTRSQSMSRPGQKFMGVPEGSEITTIRPMADGVNWFQVKEFQTIRYLQRNSDKVTSLGFYLRAEGNESSSAQFLAIIRDPETKEELCRAFTPVNKLGEEKLHWFRLIRTTKDDLLIDISLIDDINRFGVPVETNVEILFGGEDNHSIAEHEVPNLDKALREKPYKFEPGVGMPLTSLKTTAWKTFPVWLQNGHFVSEKKRWMAVGVIKADGQKAVYKYPYLEVLLGGKKHQRITGPITEMIPPANIDQSATQVRMVQAGDALYYVDGYSRMQRVNLTSWAVEFTTPTSTDILGFIPKQYYYKGNVIFEAGSIRRAKKDFEAGATFVAGDWDTGSLSDYEAWPGASLIYFMNNRLFLSGFQQPTVGSPAKSEPNLVMLSSIDSVAPKYDFFNRSVEFFYTPDRAAASTATSPITGFADLNDNLVVFMTDNLSFISIPNGIEFGGSQQTTPHGAGYGTLQQEHIAQGRNNIYFYNMTEGIMRLGGSISSIVSRPVDALLKRIKNPEQSFMQIHKDSLRFYYHEKGEENNSCLYNYVNYAQHRSYWFGDQNTPIAYVNSDNGYDIELGVGSEYPCVIETEVQGSADFDCSIVYEYHTNYMAAPNKINEMIVRRVHVTSMQDFNSSIFIGLDVDHKDNPIVWRRFIEYNEPDRNDADDIFYDTEDRGSKTVSARILTNNVRLVQIRVKQFCYESQAGVLQMGLEYGEAINL